MAENTALEAKIEPKKLTDTQRARIERNRQRALLLKQASLAKHPHRSIRSQSVKKTIDTGGGFILEEEDIPKAPMKIVERTIPPMILNLEDRLHCDECSQEFMESYLFSNFGVPVCNNCRDVEGKHRLITKTEARMKFLLKDCDFDGREPPLKCILKRNPHYQHGEMKLYLYDQIHNRAMEVWESDELLDAEHERREAEQEKRKNKKYAKKMKDLRMNVRSSLYKRNLEGHQHEYGPEEYNSDDDEYTKICSACDHKLTYEKM